MNNFTDSVLGYAQRIANYLCDWPDQGWLGDDLAWESLKKQAPLPPYGLGTSQIKLIRRATAFGAVAGRPQTHPSSVEWFRDKLRRLKRAGKRYGLVELLDECFEVGYRTANNRGTAAASAVDAGLSAN
jgi:hypothetical protein